MAKMDEAQRQEFLAGVHVGVMGIERADGPPLTVPVWYAYEPGGQVEVITNASSVKGKLAAAANRASLCAQQEELPYKYVTVEGPVEIESLGDDYVDAILPMATRYLGEEMGRGYVTNSGSGDQIVIRLQPERWYSVDYSQ